MKKILLPILLVISVQIMAQKINLKGIITDADTKEPLAGANIVVKGKLAGTISDASGNFSLSTSEKLPLVLVITNIGFQKQELEVNNESQALAVPLKLKSELVDEVVISASRVEENILQSPVSIEKMDVTAIRETPSFNFYDGLQNVKSLEMVTCGLTYKQVNTRGFNDSGNS